MVERARPVISETASHPAARTSLAANTRRPRSSSFAPTAFQRLRIALQSIMPIRISRHRSARNPAASSHIATCRLTQNRFICWRVSLVALTAPSGPLSKARNGSIRPVRQARRRTASIWAQRSIRSPERNDRHQHNDPHRYRRRIAPRASRERRLRPRDDRLSQARLAWLGARLLNAEATGFAARGRKVSGHSSFLVGACRGLSRCKGGGRRNPPLSELQEIVGEADEAPLGGDLHDAAQQKLTEAARLLDLSEHRLGQLLS